MTELRLLTTRPQPLARILQGALAADGIDATLERDALAEVYGLDSGLHATRVYVSAAELARAEEIIRVAESGE